MWRTPQALSYSRSPVGASVEGLDLRRRSRPRRRAGPCAARRASLAGSETARPSISPSRLETCPCRVRDHGRAGLAGRRLEADDDIDHGVGGGGRRTRCARRGGGRRCRWGARGHPDERGRRDDDRDPSRPVEDDSAGSRCPSPRSLRARTAGIRLHRARRQGVRRCSCGARMRRCHRRTPPSSSRVRPRPSS